MISADPQDSSGHLSDPGEAFVEEVNGDPRRFAPGQGVMG
jgi:hypothetical protein